MPYAYMLTVGSAPTILSTSYTADNVPTLDAVKSADDILCYFLATKTLTPDQIAIAKDLSAYYTKIYNATTTSIENKDYAAASDFRSNTITLEDFNTIITNYNKLKDYISSDSTKNINIDLLDFYERLGALENYLNGYLNTRVVINFNNVINNIYQHSETDGSNWIIEEKNDIVLEPLETGFPKINKGDGTSIAVPVTEQIPVTTTGGITFFKRLYYLKKIIDDTKLAEPAIGNSTLGYTTITNTQPTEVTRNSVLVIKGTI